MAGFPSVAKGNKLGEKAKRPRPCIPLDPKVIADLIVRHTGNLSRIADTMGSHRGVVRKVIDNNPQLQELLRDARERWLDDIEESVLSRAAESTDTGLQCFVLKTQARHRGWEQDENKNAAKDIATAAFDYILGKSKESIKPKQ
jgi:hypothetical protein